MLVLYKDKEIELDDNCCIEENNNYNEIDDTIELDMDG